MFGSPLAMPWVSQSKITGQPSSSVDSRPLLPPPMSTSYTGNCLFTFVVALSGTSLMCTNGFGRTCDSIAETVRTTKEDVMRANGRAKVMVDFGSLNGLKVVLVGSNRLEMYGVDFGWGKPSLMVHASMNHDGEVVMVAGKEKGTVQLTVGLNYKAMNEFARAFSEGLNLASNNIIYLKQDVVDRQNKYSENSKLSNM